MRSRSACMTPGRLACITAASSGVRPERLRALTSAPASRRSRAASRWPRTPPQASIRGVLPAASLPSTPADDERVCKASAVLSSSAVISDLLHLSCTNDWDKAQSEFNVHDRLGVVIRAETREWARFTAGGSESANTRHAYEEDRNLMPWRCVGNRDQPTRSCMGKHSLKCVQART